MFEKNLNVSSGALADGCTLCLIGRKMTLFITGICPNSCYYCPVSSDRMGKDVMFANERRITSVEEAVEEAKTSGAIGTAITGGEPLVVVGRVAEYVAGLKHALGDAHHIHLYSGFPRLTRENAKRLYEAGLDEIRFHIIATEGVEDSVRVASEFDWRVGVEIPALPELDFISVAKRAKDAGAQFMVLDEYEVNEENFFTHTLRAERRSEPLVSVSPAKILDTISKIRGILPVHYCTVKSKYLIQYRNRLVSSFYARRPKNAV
ncbi:MAG: radical SAM protein, partial [Thermoprotei archaeon]